MVRHFPAKFRGGGGGGGQGLWPSEPPVVEDNRIVKCGHGAHAAMEVATSSTFFLSVEAAAVNKLRY